MNLEKWPKQTFLVAGLLLLLAMSLVSVALAQTGGGYDLTWHTVDGGGGQVSGGGYTLTGTAGQHDTGAPSGGGYTLLGGFWGGGAAALPYPTYLPLVLHKGP
jgi:uncharacterized membrane protein